MFRKGHKLFSFAAIAMIVAAVVQLLVYFFAWQDELAATGMLASMQGFRFDYGPGDPNVWESHESLSIALSVMLLWTGLINLLIARYTSLRDKLMRRSCTLNIIFVALLMLLFSFYRMFLPVICMTVAEVLFVIARYRLRRSRYIGDPNSAFKSPTL